MKKQHLQPLTPAALYARVSSDRQDVDLSVAAQLRALKEYAKANGYSVAREYVDEAESGRVADRPQFREMIAEGSKPQAPFEVILVWKFSRFTRKREHAVAFKAQLRRKGIRVVSITEQAEDNATGRLLEGIIESVDEYYSENLAQEVVRGMREAASRGFFLGSKAPFGYRKIKVQDGAKERPSLEVDPATAPVVKEIFEKSLSGHGLKELCKELNDRGVTNRGKRWYKGGLHYVLRNEAYTGTAVWGLKGKGEKAQDPVRVEGAWPALISRELFEEVQQAMSERAPKVQRPARVGSPYLLSGLLKCGVCGRLYSAQGAKSGQFAYYICGTLFREGAGTCSARYLNASRVEEFVVEKIRERILTEETIVELVQLVAEEIDAMAGELAGRLESVEAELSDVQRRLGKLYEAIETSDLTLEVLSPRIMSLRHREEQLEAAREDAETQLEQRRVDLPDTEEIARYVADFREFLKEGTIPERKALIRNFVEGIEVVGDEATLTYTVPMPRDGVTKESASVLDFVQSGPVSETGRWMRVELVGEVIAGTFERGISQYPNIGDTVHLAVEEHLHRIYDIRGQGYVVIGTLASAESISAKVALDELVTRHSAILGSTGSGKSTTVASLLRAITAFGPDSNAYPNARILMLDIHGEYSTPLADVSKVFSVEPQHGEEKLFVPYWALDTEDLLDFLTGRLEGNRETAFTDKIFELKSASHSAQLFPGVQSGSITVDTPLPFSLKRLWHELIDFEIATFEGKDRDESTRQDPGDPNTLTPPRYKPHAMGATGPFLNQQAFGIQRPLNLLRSRLLDRRYDFLLRPGPWEPDLDGTAERDLDSLLSDWLGGDKPITILDLSAVPSSVLERLIGSILKIIYEALFWSREKTEGGIQRPLLIVMEEAHRYLSDISEGTASDMVQRIVKEGRKYGVGAMIVSQRPSEVNETILSQCGTFFALRLSNPSDRDRVRGTLPDGLVGLLDVLPILRTGEAIVTGEAAKLPMRCRVSLPAKENRPRSEDPEVSRSWNLPRRKEGYERVVASWRAQSPLAVANLLNISRTPVEDESDQE